MAQDFSSFRPSRIWRRLPVERRLAAAELFWADEQSTDQQIEAVNAIAAHMKFRTKTVVSLPLEKKSKYLSSLPSISDSIAARALVNYHLGRQRPMMTAFLDSLGIENDEGLIKEEDVTKPEAERLRAAAAGLAETFPAEDVSLYLSTLVSQDPETWGDLADAPQTVVAVAR
jgi:hypothetical protein